MLLQPYKINVVKFFLLLLQLYVPAALVIFLSPSMHTFYCMACCPIYLGLLDAVGCLFLRRCSQVLLLGFKMTIISFKYFGCSLFLSVVVVVTLPQHVFNIFIISQTLFYPKEHAILYYSKGLFYSLFIRGMPSIPFLSYLASNNFVLEEMFLLFLLFFFHVFEFQN